MTVKVEKTDTAIKAAIPVTRYDRLQREVAKLNKRAQKLGIDTRITVTREASSRKKEIAYDHHVVYEGEGQTHTVKKTIEVYDITIDGMRPQYDGWEFVASIEPTVGGVLIKGYEEVPDKYRDADTALQCDHCKTNRYRKNTYIVRKGGEYKRVGKSCLKDFCGNKSLAGFIARLERFEDIIDRIGDYDDDYYGGCYYESTYGTQEYLAVVSAAIRQYGWTSRTQAHDGIGQATADIALNYFSGSYSVAKDIREEIKVMDTDKKTAEDTIKWARNGLEDRANNDYIKNVIVALAEDYIEEKAAGIVASAIMAYRKEIEGEKRKEKTANSQHIGEIKEKIEADIEVIMVREIDGNYGVTSLYKMLDEQGNVYVWFATSMHEWEQGDKKSIRGIVKAHTIYNGEKQTMLTRVKENK